MKTKIMSKFEQFFASKKVILASLVITLVTFAIIIVMNSIIVFSELQSLFSLAFAVIMFFIALTMYRSFAKHETNSMNIVTGAAIGIFLVNNIQFCLSTLYGVQYDSFQFYIFIIDAVLCAILLVNHVRINSNT